MLIACTRDVPITLVPNCKSNPSFVVCSMGGVMTPPLLKRTSRRVSLLHERIIIVRWSAIGTGFSRVPEEFRDRTFDRLEIGEVHMQDQRYLPCLFA